MKQFNELENDLWELAELAIQQQWDSDGKSVCSKLMACILTQAERG
jgi:hypothetical protein